MRLTLILKCSDAPEMVTLASFTRQENLSNLIIKIDSKRSYVHAL